VYGALDASDSIFSEPLLSIRDIATRKQYRDTWDPRDRLLLVTSLILVN
jgi:hypothetical protein